MRIVVCEAQVPFVEGGAEYHVRELVRQLRLHGHQTELVSVPFKWYPKDEILAHAAAWRFLDLSESNGTPHRPGHRHQVPVVFRPPPAQGGVADPPVPRRLRAGRHGLQRLPPRRGRRRPARSADRARSRDARRMPAASSPTPATPPTASPATMACTPNRCIIRRGWPSGSGRGPLRRLRALGRPHRERQAGRSRGAGAGPRRSRPCGWSSPATARSAPTPSGSSTRSASAIA